MTIPRRVAALWLVAVSVWAAWGPFVGIGSRPRIALYYFGGLGDLLSNLLLLAPLAGLLAVPHARGPTAPRHPLLVIAVLSVVLEAGQLYLGGRYVQVSDIGTNILGGALAIASVRLLMRRGADGQRIVAGLVAATFLVVTVVLMSYAVRVETGLRFAGWVPDGAEVSELRLRAGPEVEGTATRVCAGAGDHERCVAPTRDQPSLLALARAAEATQQVTLVTRVLRDTAWRENFLARLTTREGPLLDLWHRDATVVLRVHTVLTTGTARPQFALPDALPAGEPVTVRAVFDRGDIRIEAVTPNAKARGRYRLGLLRSWMLIRSPRFLTPSGLTRAAVTAAIVFCVPVAVAAGAVARRRWDVLAGALAALAGVAAINAALGVPADPLESLFTFVVGGATARLAAWDRGRPFGRDPGRVESASPVS